MITWLFCLHCAVHVDVCAMYRDSLGHTEEKRGKISFHRMIIRQRYDLENVECAKAYIYTEFSHL